MKIAIIGYGKMGKAIEAIAISKGHLIVARVGDEGDFSKVNEADVAIEFSQPSAASKNILECLAIGVPVVVGTTGWYHQFDLVKQAVIAHNGTLFTATNFSLGVNIFFYINKMMAKAMNAFPEYAVGMEEIHHVHKLDHPSGTAVTLAQDIIQNLDRKEDFLAYKHGELINQDERMLEIKCFREAEAFGFHKVSYTSPIDTIEISHNANSREGFATGAVLAAEWVLGKKGIFGMQDLLNFDNN